MDDDTTKKSNDGLIYAASVAVKGVATIGSMDVLINLGGTVGAPVLAATGIGVPLAVLLVLVYQIAKKNKENKELEKVINHAIHIVEQCYQLHCANITQILCFYKEIKNIQPVPEKQREPSDILSYCVDERLLKTIKKMIDDLYNTLKEVVKQDGQDEDKKSYYGQTKIFLGKSQRFYNRNVKGSWYTKELLKELTLLNSYFILYESKVNKIIQRYEHYLKANGRERIIKDIWKTIYKDESYKNFITKNSDSHKLIEFMEETKGNIKKQEKGDTIQKTFKKQINLYKKKQDALEKKEQAAQEQAAQEQAAQGKKKQAAGKTRRNLRSCCRSTKKQTHCVRKDGKRFQLPRKFSKKQCKRPKGYSMRSSCAPYKFCKKRQNSRIKNKAKTKKTI